MKYLIFGILKTMITGALMFPFLCLCLIDVLREQGKGAELKDEERWSQLIEKYMI